MTDERSDSRGEARQSYFAKQQMINEARGVLQLLSAVIKNCTLYPESHPILTSASEKLKAKIEDLLIGRKEVSFFVVAGELFFEKVSIPVDQSLASVIEQLTVRNIGGVSFRLGLTVEELIRFAGLLNREEAYFTGNANITALMQKAGLSHIEMQRVVLVDKNVGNIIKAGKQKATEIFQEAIDAVKDMVHATQLEKGTNTRKMNTIVQNMVDNILENRDVFLGLTNIKMYDEYTFAHSVNVSVLAVSLGTYLGLQKQQTAALGLAGLMHDIGKLYVPHEIINKPGKLTTEEWEAVKRHPVEGALVLAGTPNISKLAMVAAFEHHQHPGPGGYPLRESEGGRQHPFSQIVSLVDAYDAITAARVYYSTYTSTDQGVRILLKKRGNPFNPVLVNAFVKMIGIFPIGTVVKLNTGQIGLVKHQTSDLMRPRVLLLTKFDGSEKDNEPLSLLDTVKGEHRYSIVGTINPSAARLDVKKYLT
jgi:HD-GYP domain-containing protein (c-di-GMP phosphodiesterase class II)